MPPHIGSSPTFSCSRAVSIKRRRTIAGLLALKPDAAEACSNLGIALASQSKWAEAVAHYRRALALNPQLLDVYRNLGRVLLLQGESAEAMMLARRALAISETEETKAFFVQCAKGLPAAAFDATMRALVARALSEGWSRPSELSALAIDLLKQRHGGPILISPSWATTACCTCCWKPRRSAVSSSSAASPPCAVRCWKRLSKMPSMLQTFAFYGALARQCFINEYVFACGEDEARRVRQLSETICHEPAIRRRRFRRFVSLPRQPMRHCTR